jgi:rod shape-determining protein MreC
MFIVLQWLKRNSYPLLAFFLFGFAVNQIMRFQIYQHSYYYNSSISFFRTIDQWRNNVSSYLNLKNENEGLRQENLLLRGQLSINKAAVNTFKDTTYFDSISKSLNNYKVVYTYIRANIVKNTVNSRNNYFIIDQGKNQGILDGMAVISPTGIVGVIINTADNFSRGMSVLNSKFEITPYIPKIELRQGVIGWSGMDYTVADLKEVNRTEQLKKGMQVVTSNYSSIFPPNIPIGTVKEVSQKNNSNFHQITIKLSTDFSRLQTVYCIKNNYHLEIDSLSNPIIDEVK